MIKIFHHTLRHPCENRVVDRRRGRSSLDLYYHSKHIKGTMNNQGQEFTKLGLVFYVAVIYFGPHGAREQWQVNAPGAFFVMFCDVIGSTRCTTHTLSGVTITLSGGSRKYPYPYSTGQM